MPAPSARSDERYRNRGGSPTDKTRQIAEDLIQRKGIVIETNAGCVGSSRALAAEIALGRYRGPRERCWLANTDADCEVPADWLVQQLSVAEVGYAAVAGIVDVDSFIEHGGFGSSAISPDVPDSH